MVYLSVSLSIPFCPLPSFLLLSFLLIDVPLPFISLVFLHITPLPAFPAFMFLPSKSSPSRFSLPLSLFYISTLFPSFPFFPPCSLSTSHSSPSFRLSFLSPLLLSLPSPSFPLTLLFTFLSLSLSLSPYSTYGEVNFNMYHIAFLHKAVMMYLYLAIIVRICCATP